MKSVIKVLLLTLIGFSAASQLPKGTPITNSSGYHKLGYVQADSGFINSVRNLNWIPKYRGTMVWHRTSTDTSLWVWDSYWHKIGGSNTTVTGQSYTTLAPLSITNNVIRLDTATGTIGAATKGYALNLANGKVDKVAGKGLSSADYTAAEKTKLAGIATGATVNSTDAQLRNRATHTGVQPISSVEGLSNVLDSKQGTLTPGANITIIGNVISSTAGGGGGGTYTASQPLLMIGSNITADTTSNNGLSTKANAQKLADTKVDKVAGKVLSTNDYTSAEKSKLAGIASGATANSSDAVLMNRNNHTGTQTASTISDFMAAVRGQFSAGTNITIDNGVISSSGGGGGGTTTGDVITWSAASRNILGNGTDQTSAINAAFADGNLNTLWFNSNGTYRISGTVDAQGKVLRIEKGAKFIGNGTLANMILSAGGDYQIFDTTLNINPRAIEGVYLYVDWFGANPLDGNDDWQPCQKAVNTAIANKLPSVQFNSGNYVLSREIAVSRNFMGVGHINEFVQINMRGVEGIYDQNISRGTKLTCLNTQTGGIFIRNGKGCIIENFEIQGVNLMPGSYNQYQSQTDPNSTWVTPGLRDTRYSPNAGICVDPTGSVPTYPGLEYMSTGGTRGSTKVMMRNLSIHDFVVDICISPNGVSQNAEIITMDHITLGAAKVGVSTGNTQTRTCWFDHGMIWAHMLYAFDAQSYGSVNAQLVDVMGVNMAGGQRWLFNIGSTQNMSRFHNVYAELLNGLGGDLTGAGIGTDVYFDGCDIRLEGSVLEGGPVLARDPVTILKGRTANFVNCWLFKYGSYATGLNMDVQSVSMVNCHLTDYIYNRSGNVKYTMTEIYGITYDNDMEFDGTGQNFVADNLASKLLTRAIINNTGARRLFLPSTITVAPGVSGTVTSIEPFYPGTDSILNRWTYQVSNPNDIAHVMRGDDLRIFSSNFTDEFGTKNRVWSLGKIDSVNYNTGHVRVQNLRPGIEVGLVLQEIYLTRQHAVKPYHIGTAASGSTVFTNVIRESSNTAIAYHAGETVVSPVFAGGFAVVQSVSGTSITFSKPALYSGRAVLNMFPYKQTITLPSLASSPTIGYKLGDEIEVVNEATNTLMKYVCTVPGIYGNATYAPTFQVVTLQTPN